MFGKPLNRAEKYFMERLLSAIKGYSPANMVGSGNSGHFF